MRPCRAPRPCCLRLRSRSPLRVAAGCGWRGSIRALACGPARGPPAPAGRGAPSPSASAALSLAAAAGGALALLRSGSGCVSSPSPRSASPASAPSPALWAGAAPRASPAALCPASRSRRGGGAALGLSPSLAALGLRPAAWVRSGAAAPVRLRARGWGSAGCGQRGRPARSRGRILWPYHITSPRAFPYKQHTICRSRDRLLTMNHKKLVTPVALSQETCYAVRRRVGDSTMKGDV